MVDDKFLIESDWVGVRARKISEINRRYKVLRHESLTDTQKDEIVNLGQMIGKIPDNNLGASVHASIGGKVKEITEDYVIIES